jgi:hypothetical protein
MAYSTQVGYQPNYPDMIRKMLQAQQPDSPRQAMEMAVQLCVLVVVLFFFRCCGCSCCLLFSLFLLCYYFISAGIYSGLNSVSRALALRRETAEACTAPARAF